MLLAAEDSLELFEVIVHLHLEPHIQRRKGSRSPQDHYKTESGKEERDQLEEAADGHDQLKEAGDRCDQPGGDSCDFRSTSS